MKTKLLILFILLRGLVVFSQDTTNSYLKTVESLLSNYKAEQKLDSLAVLAHDVSVTFYKKRDYKKAIYFAKKEVDLGRHVLGSVTYKKALYNLARFYYNDSQFKTSINTYKTIIDSFEVDVTTYKSFCQIGRNYNELRDYYQAVNYFEKGISNPDVFKKSSLAGHYSNYANALKNTESKKNLDKGMSLLKEVESIYSNLNTSDRKYLDLNNNIAEYYKMDLIFDYNKSEAYFKKTLQLAIKIEDTFRLMRTYNNYGKLLNQVDNDSAVYYLKKGASLSQDKSQIHSKLYFNLSEYYSKKQKHVDALKAIQKSLQLIIPSKIDSSFNSSISLKEASTFSNKALVWDIITEKAKLHLDYFNTSNDKRQVVLALDNLKIADALLDDIRLDSFESNSKLVLQDYATTTYMQAIRACYALQDFDQAFYYVEKNKALLLLENISEDQIKKQANLPQNVLNQEALIKENLSALEIALEQSESNTDSLQNIFYDTKIQYANFIKSLEKDYPEFYNFKAPTHVITLEDVKDNLSEKTLVLEYILNDKEGYVLAISKGASKLYKLNSVNQINNDINSYLHGISRPFVTTEDINTSKVLSQRLSEQLLPFLNDSISNNKTELTIVPDYTLQYIPFESLSSSTPSEYLIHDFEISYTYSLSFLDRNKSIHRKAPDQFLGVAPSTFNYSGLTTLRNSTLEITAAEQLYSGTTLFNNLATKKEFLSRVKDYKIIHLSTHADANDSISPWIAFKDEKLYLNELYNTKNQAELVVLSACNSTLGNIRKGEGVFSLARGFFYSGAHSVVSTLWNVNDKSTQEILSSFYTNLKEGKSKATSLRQAKLDYLENHSHSELSPYYWSSLILVGDHSEISTTSNTWIYLLCLISLAILFFLYKTKKGNLS